MYCGRPPSFRKPDDVSPKTPVPAGTEKAADRVFALGCALVAGLLVWMGAAGIQDRVRSSADSPPLPPDAVPVMSSGFTAEEREELAWETDRSAAAEPFGYLDGAWNVWEYLGDLFSSLLLP